MSSAVDMVLFRASGASFTASTSRVIFRTSVSVFAAPSVPPSTTRKPSSSYAVPLASGAARYCRDPVLISFTVIKSPAFTGIQSRVNVPPVGNSSISTAISASPSEGSENPKSSIANT